MFVASFEATLIMLQVFHLNVNNFFQKLFSSGCFCVARLRQQIILYHHIKGCAIVFFDIISTLLKNISNPTMPIALP